MRPFPAYAAALLLLGGCAAAGGWIKAGWSKAEWTKAGVDEAATASDYRDCRALAATAVEKQADIDQDILATRQNDWQRGGLGRAETRTVQEQTRDRAGAIIDSCMRAKGYAKPG